jgi:hypothetical protein
VYASVLLLKKGGMVAGANAPIAVAFGRGIPWLDTPAATVPPNVQLIFYDEVSSATSQT